MQQSGPVVKPNAAFQEITVLATSSAVSHSRSSFDNYDATLNGCLKLCHRPKAISSYECDYRLTWSACN